MTYDVVCRECGQQVRRYRAIGQSPPLYCGNTCMRRGVTRRSVASVASRFWDRVDKNGACWTWRGYLNNKGYGTWTARGRTKLAHRWAWELVHGAIPGGLCVLHRCDNPPCVRPDHLFLGTLADNNRDMAAKGRHRGSSGQRWTLATPRKKAGA